MLEGQKGTILLPTHIQQNLEKQYWPSACLYVVATPIGNLMDLSWRALYVLEQADVIACEDTRTTQALLNVFGIKKQLFAAHQHNEREASAQINQWLQEDKRVALVSDAGAPAVSDPGAKIVEQAHLAGFQVCPIPGASAVISCLMAAGFTSDEYPSFCFVGFAPTKAKARDEWLAKLAKKQQETIVFFESPHRIKPLAKALQTNLDPERFILIGRELSKRHEEVKVLQVKDVFAWLEENDNHLKGEFVLALSPKTEKNDSSQHEAMDVLIPEMLKQGVSVRDIVKILSKALKIPKDHVYEQALGTKSELENSQ